MASDNLVSITINDKSLRRSLRALDLAATDLEPAMRKIAGTLLAETQFNFLDEGRPGWMPSLAAEERDGQTLQDTGRLMGSVSTDHDDRQAVVGTNVVYGAIHQFGGKTGRNESVELPARPFLPVTGDGELQPEVVIPSSIPLSAILNQRPVAEFSLFRRVIYHCQRMRGCITFIKALQPLFYNRFRFTALLSLSFSPDVF